MFKVSANILYSGRGGGRKPVRGLVLAGITERGEEAMLLKSEKELEMLVQGLEAMQKRVTALEDQLFGIHVCLKCSHVWASQVSTQSCPLCGKPGYHYECDAQKSNYCGEIEGWKCLINGGGCFLTGNPEHAIEGSRRIIPSNIKAYEELKKSALNRISMDRGVTHSD